MNASVVLSLPPETLATIPAGTPPAGVQALSDHPASRGWILILVNTILAVIMTTCIAIRIHTRVRIQRKMVWSDFLLLAGYLFAMICYFATIIQVIDGGLIGFHRWDLSLKVLLSKRNAVPLYLLNVFNNPASGCIKLSILIMYLEVFVGLRWMQICVYIGATFTSLFYLSMSILMFYFSTPVGGVPFRAWVFTSKSTMSKNLGIPLSAISLGIDIYLFILPLIAVSNLRIAKKKKIFVMIGFGIGLIACIGSLLSLIYRVKNIQSSDNTWNALPVIIVTLVELFCGVIIACFPSLVLFSRTYQKSSNKMGVAIASWLCCTKCRKPDTVAKSSQGTSNPSERAPDEDKNLYPDLDFLTKAGDVERGELEKQMENRIGRDAIAG